MHIKYLSEKLDILYRSGRRPDITNHGDLANRLGITRTAIHNWIGGRKGDGTDSIPEKHIAKICQLFAIEQLFFVGDYPLGRFEEKIADKRGGWISLLRMSQSDKNLMSIMDGRNEIAAGMRGVKFPSAQLNGDDPIKIGEFFRVKVIAPVGSSVLFILQDPVTVRGFALNASKEYLKSPRTSEFVLPPFELSPAQAEEPAGGHCFLSLISEDPWPESYVHDLASEEESLRSKALRSLAEEVKYRKDQKETKPFVLNYPFEIK